MWEKPKNPYKMTSLKFNRHTAAFAILDILRRHEGEVHQNEIVSDIARAFGREDMAKLKLEVSFSLSRLKALRLVRRSGNGYNNVTELGRSISLADMIAIDRFYASQERRERYAKRQR